MSESVLMPLRADEDFEAYVAALEFMENLRVEYRRCRRRKRHDFENGRSVDERVNPDGTLHLETACFDCGTIIIEDTTARGYYIKNPKYIWPEDYLKKKGETGLVNGEDASAAIRAMRAYERLGRPLPNNVRKLPRRRTRTPR